MSLLEPLPANTQELISSIRHNPFSLDEALQTITAILNDPMQNVICPRKLRYAASRVHDERRMLPSLAKQLRFMKSKSQFLRASIRFLTFRRTPVDFAALIAHLTRPCQCEEHATVALPVATGVNLIDLENMYSLMEMLWLSIEFLDLTLTGMTKNKYRSVDPSLPAESQPWPFSPYDLLPFGVQDSIDMLGVWTASQIGGSSVCSLIATLAKFYDPFADAAIDPPFYNFILRMPLWTLTRTLDLFEYNPSIYQGYPGTVEGAISSTFDIFCVLLVKPQFKAGVKATSSIICPVLDRISRLLPSLSFPHPAQPRQIRNGIEAVRSVAEGSGRIPRLESNSISATFQEMLDTRKGGCGCVVCPLAQDIVRTSKCARCDLVSFCSKEVSHQAVVRSSF